MIFILQLLLKALYKQFLLKKQLHLGREENVKIIKNGPGRGVIGLVGQFYPLITIMYAFFEIYTRTFEKRLIL